MHSGASSWPKVRNTYWEMRINFFRDLIKYPCRVKGRVPIRRLYNLQLTKNPGLFDLDLTPFGDLLLRLTKLNKVKSRQSGPLRRETSSLPNNLSSISHSVDSHCCTAWLERQTTPICLSTIFHGTNSRSNLVTWSDKRGWFQDASLFSKHLKA